MPCFKSKKVLTGIAAFLLAFLAVSGVFADFNSSLDSILAEKSLTYGGASYILLTGAGAAGEDITFEKAAGIMKERIPSSEMEWNKPVTLGMFSYLAMETYGIKGGLLYKFFPGPRYALREMRFKRYVQGRAFNGMNVSGERALRIINRIIEKQEGRI